MFPISYTSPFSRLVMASDFKTFSIWCNYLSVLAPPNLQHCLQKPTANGTSDKKSGLAESPDYWGGQKWVNLWMAEKWICRLTYVIAPVIRIIYYFLLYWQLMSISISGGLGNWESYRRDSCIESNQMLQLVTPVKV